MGTVVHSKHTRKVEQVSFTGIFFFNILCNILGLHWALRL